MAARVVTVFGGSGFIGRHLVQRLASRGWIVRVAVRRPRRALFLQPLGNVGQITPVAAALQHPETVRAAVEGADAVVNLVGLLYERGSQNFEAVHAAGAGLVAESARDAGATDLVQMSALGADPNAEADYARTKAAGEAAVHDTFPDSVIVRPSIVFGPEDSFFNRFAALANILPALPLIGGGKTRFQPVYVGDVAEAIAVALERPECRGRIYELGGPKTYSFEEMLRYLLEQIGKKRFLLPLPFGLAEFEGAILEKAPLIEPPLTRDQVRLLKKDNVVSGDTPTFKDLGIEPTAVETVVPSYLDRYRQGGRFGIGSRAA